MDSFQAVPLPGRRDINRKDLKKAHLLATLAEQFLPHVDVVLHPRAKKGINSMMKLILDNEQPTRDLVSTVLRGTAPPERVRAFRACGIGLRPLTLQTLTREADRGVVDAVENASMILVRAWLDTFVTPPDGNLSIETDALDGGMMPELDYRSSKRFSSACRKAGLTLDEAMEILCKVRSSLPEGTAFPDAAAEYLDASVITACP